MSRPALRDIIISTFNHETEGYLAPSSLTYNWCYGYIALLMFAIQIISGIILAMWYIPQVLLAFDSVQYIMMEVNSGWLIRYLHVNCVSFVFISMYLHIFRGLYYGSFSFPRVKVWLTGLIILLLMIVTAFLGYVLPWGQMSYWGATVITSFLSVIPYFGKGLQIYVWGGFYIDQATLGKFFSLHYLLPFLIIAMIALHLIYLHSVGSNNPLGIETNDRIPLYPYFIWKDAVWFLFFLNLLFLVVFFSPNMLNHPDNSIPANPASTPEHIVPEWYFLVFYAILRSVPNKEIGVIMMIASIVVLGLLTFLLRYISEQLQDNLAIQSGKLRTIVKALFWSLFFLSVELGILGGSPLATPYLEISQILTFFYFLTFLVLFPYVLIEDNLYIMMNKYDGNVENLKEKESIITTLSKMNTKENYILFFKKSFVFIKEKNRLFWYYIDREDEFYGEKLDEYIPKLKAKFLNDKERMRNFLKKTSEDIKKSKK